MTSILSKLGPRKPTQRAIGARAWYERGLAAEAIGDLAGARAAYVRALAANPELPDAACNLGRLLHEAGDVLGAEQWYRVALLGARDVATYWFNLGVAVEDQDRAAEAIACYERALACEPRLAEAHFNLARIYERAGAVDVPRAAVRHLSSYRTFA